MSCRVADCWILHADSAWSAHNFDLDPEDVVHRLTALTSSDSLLEEGILYFLQIRGYSATI